MKTITHCLTREEYKQILDKEIREVSYDDEYVEELFEDCKYWDTRLIGINHQLSIILEQYMKQGIDCDSVINFVYSLEEKGANFHIEEMTSEFITHLFINYLPRTSNLEECLIEAQNSIYG